jgi:predicted NUDIX family phosphoesterase
MDLDDRAAEILARIPILDEQSRSIRRPIYIEFSGTPKSGKTTTLDGLERFLRHNGFSVGRVVEAASESPIRTKDHFFFNVWTGCTTLRRIIEEYDRSDLHFLLIDRGIFDALWWFEWMRMTARITDNEKQAIVNFFALDAWLNLIDIVFVMRAAPQEALRWESGEFPTRRAGKIMTEEVLTQLNSCLDKILLEWRSKFRRVIEFSAAANRTDVNAKIAGETLDAMDAFLDEKLWVVPRESILGLGITSGLSTNPEILSGLREALAKGFALRRSLAESNRDVIQVIPCGVLRFKDEVLLLRRREANKTHRLNDAYVLWAGGHIRLEDVETGPQIDENCLRRELKEELWIKSEFHYKPICCVYDTTNWKSAQHLALMFEVTISSRDISIHMQTDFKEFKEGKGKSVSGKFFPIRSIDSKYIEGMERWSMLLLRDYFKIPIEIQPEQTTLFAG